MSFRAIFLILAVALCGCTGGDASSVHGDARGGDFVVKPDITIVQNPGMQVGYSCVNGYGAVMCTGPATPINTACYCASPMGPIWGVVR